MKYDDFELQILSGSGDDYRVIAKGTAGYFQEVVRFPLDPVALEKHLSRVKQAIVRSVGINRLGAQRVSTTRKLVSTEQLAVQEFGKVLFGAVFQGEVLAQFVEARNEAERRSRPLRIKLRIQDAKLASLPWEFLFDSKRNKFLGLSKQTPLVRWPDLPLKVKLGAIPRPLRVLCMVPSPSDRDGIDSGQEKVKLERALQRPLNAGRVELAWMEGQTRRDLQRKLRNGPWHVFHFIGHGGFNNDRKEGFIVIEGENRTARELLGTELAMLLADDNNLRLVVLNSCEGASSDESDLFSSVAATLTQSGVPAVIAMQYEVSDNAAIKFSQEFYEALVDGYPVDISVSEARKAMYGEISGSVEWGTPVLFMRTADGRLFDAEERQSGVRENVARVDKARARDQGPQPDAASDSGKFEIERNERDTEQRQQDEADIAAQKEMESQQLEAERRDREEASRQRREAERRRQEEIERQRLETERQAREAAEKQRLEAEREEAEWQRLETERLAKEAAEKQRLEAERFEREQVERQRLEAERQRLEAARQAGAAAEKQRLEARRKEQEQAERQRLEAERQAQEAAEKQRLEARRKEQEQAERQRLEAERQAQEAAEKQRLEAERAKQQELERQGLEAVRGTQVKKSFKRNFAITIIAVALVWLIWPTDSPPPTPIPSPQPAAEPAPPPVQVAAPALQSVPVPVPTIAPIPTTEPESAPGVPATSKDARDQVFEMISSIGVDEGRFETAYKRLLAAVPPKMASSDARKLNEEGRKISIIEDYINAEPKYREAFALNPTDVEIADNLAISLVRQGKASDALPFAMAAIVLQPYRVNNWSTLGEIHAVLGKEDYAVNCFLITYRISPKKNSTETYLREQLATNLKRFESIRRAAEIALSRIN